MRESFDFATFFARFTVCYKPQGITIRISVSYNRQEVTTMVYELDGNNMLFFSHFFPHFTVSDKQNAIIIKIGVTYNRPEYPTNPCSGYNCTCYAERTIWEQFLNV